MAHPFESQVRAAAVGFALTALGTASAVHAQPLPRVIYVDASAPPGGNGQLWTSAMRDLQDALFLADTRADHAQPVQIKIAQGVYTPDAGTHNAERAFVVTSAVSLMGGFAGLAGPNPGENDPTRFVSVLSGDLLHNDAPGGATRTDNSQIVVDVHDQPGIIDGLTISGGLVALHRIGFGTLAVSRCRFTDNVSSELNYPLTFDPYFAKSAIVGLTYATVTDCVFADNTSAILPSISAAYCQFTRCVIAGNHHTHAPVIGGTLLEAALFGSACALDSCLIVANSGEGVLVAGAYDLAVYNCTIADNRTTARYALGGVGAAALFNCLISRNVNSSPGAGQAQIGLQSSLALHSCQLDHGLADVFPSGPIGPASNIIAGDPRFVNPSGPDTDPLAWRDNDYRLAPNSPCIDAGDTSSAAYLGAHTDLLGRPPNDDASVPNLGLGPIPYLDLGAYEFIPNPCRADFNNSGAITPQDIFDFLNAWFALSSAADFNGSGAITPQDIFDFLNAWFAGC